jgi:cytochrome subunit of sulfide dehydrogenase
MIKTSILLALALAMLPAWAGAATAVAPPGVAACTACHPKSGGDPVLPQLAGRSANDIVAAMNAFRDGKRPATVMDRIAKGYSDDEIAAIAAWYAAQK